MAWVYICTPGPWDVSVFLVGALLWLEDESAILGRHGDLGLLSPFLNLILHFYVGILSSMWFLNKHLLCEPGKINPSFWASVFSGMMRIPALPFCGILWKNKNKRALLLSKLCTKEHSHASWWSSRTISLIKLELHSWEPLLIVFIWLDSESY